MAVEHSVYCKYCVKYPSKPTLVPKYVVEFHLQLPMIRTTHFALSIEQEQSTCGACYRTKQQKKKHYA